MTVSLPVLLLLFAIAMIAYDRHRNGRGFGKLGDKFRRDRFVQHGNSDNNDPETQRELEALRERVKVLERITVDERDTRSITDEIENLRKK